MALINRSFKLENTPGAMPPIIHVSEYDINRQFTITLTENGQVYTIPANTTAKIEGTLNGHGFSVSATVSGNTITFTLTTDMTAYAGEAYTKVVLTNGGNPVSSCAFVLAVDRAGVEASTVIGSPTFQEQINEGIAEYFDDDPPFFVLPSNGQEGQPLLSDGNGGAVWGTNGTGISADVKQALLACFRGVAWAGTNGAALVSSLETALSGGGYTPSGSDMYGWANGVAYADLTIVEGEYVRRTDGSFISYTGWNRTGYVPCDGCGTITFPPMPQVSEQPFSNVFFDANHDRVDYFTLNKTTSATITVPSTAAFFVLSSEAAALSSCISGGIVPHSPST